MDRGIRIHASVCQHFVNKFENVLKEGSVYQFKGFSVSASRDVKITCSLWGVFVDQLNTYIETSFAGTTVVALFSVKIKEFQGKITLQNAMHSTKMVFNPKFPKAIELRGCLSSDTLYIQGVSRLTSSGMPCLVHDFLTLTEAKTIVQLMELTDDIIGIQSATLLLKESLPCQLKDDRHDGNKYKGGIYMVSEYMDHDLILMQARMIGGIRIHASVCQHFVNKFENVLKEGSVYQFKGFSVSASRGEYQAAKHDCKIYFHANTKVTLLPDNMVPPSPYVFATYREILEGLHDSSYLIDVLGILTNVGEERSIDSSSGLTKLNVIELENKGVKITCSLWGVFVDQLNTYIETSFAGTTVVALFSVKIKEFQGCLSSDTPYSQGVSRLTSSGMPCLVDDFLTLTEAKTIAQLMELTDDIIDGNKY
ncbi:hypothetical protein OROGR_012022 [Orobanche gracilis]